MIKICSFFLGFLLFAGCKTMHPAFENTHVQTVIETVKDSVIIIEADTATVQALFECDSLNNVVMRELEIAKARRVSPEVRFRDKIVTVTLPVDSQAIWVSMKNRFEQKTDTLIRTKIVTVEVPAKPPWYIKLLTIIGIVALIFSVFFIKKMESQWLRKFLKIFSFRK